MCQRKSFAQAKRTRLSYQRSWDFRLERMNAFDERTRFAFHARHLLREPCAPLVTERLAFNERQRVARANKGLA